MQIPLSLLELYSKLRFKQSPKTRWVFDPIRSKWIVLQPEEFVRQLVVAYFLLEKGVNKNRITIERGLTVNGMAKRCDILIFDQKMEPFLLVECKSHNVPVTQDAFRQIANYNLPLNVPFLMVTNGVDTYCCSMNYDQRTYEFLNAIPDYPASF